MIRFVQYLFSIIFISLLTNISFITESKSEGSKESLLQPKYILVPPKMSKTKMEKALNDINQECCEENFKKKNKVFEIKDNLKKCLDKKCYTYMIPLYNKSKPPLKLIVLKQIEELDSLLLENNKFKYDSLLNIISQKEKEKRSAKLENENDIKIVKQNLIELESENENLKNSNAKLQITVEKMLKRYQKKIEGLETENKNLKSNFDKAYELLPKGKKKKLDKELK